MDATHLAGPLPERRSRLDVDKPGAWHEAIALGPDLLVQRPRPIVADLVGPGRMGLGALLAPADPMVIVDVLCYRLDGGMSASRVSPLERVRCATVVDFRDGRRFRIEHPVPGADVARLAAHVFGALPQFAAVKLSGTFTGVTVPNGTFGRADGTVLGFVTRTSPDRDWHLSFPAADRTSGGPILEISIENVAVRIVAPRVVYQAATGEQVPTFPGNRAIWLLMSAGTRPNAGLSPAGPPRTSLRWQPYSSSIAVVESQAIVASTTDRAERAPLRHARRGAASADSTSGDGSSRLSARGSPGADGRGGTVSAGPASRPQRHRDRKRSRRVGSKVQRPALTATRGDAPKATRTARARAAIDEHVWEREMNRLRRISLLLSAALAAVVARMLIDGPNLLGDLTGALILVLLFCSLALTRQGRRL